MDVVKLIMLPHFLLLNADYTKSQRFSQLYDRIAFMKVVAVKTHKITKKDTDIFKILDQYVQTFADNSVLAVTSKIISISEGRIVSTSKTNKDKLIEQEAELFLPREENKYHIMLAIKNSLLIPSAGIDESNTDGNYVLWPKDSQETANKIREYMLNRFELKHAGVIITDSKTTPLRWGVTGAAIAHSGFKALNDYIGSPDIFGKKLQYTKVNVMDALASSATLTMGEGNEQTPLAIIEDIEFVEFQDRNPTVDEIRELMISIEEDLYAPLLKGAEWKRGGS